VKSAVAPVPAVPAGVQVLCEYRAGEYPLYAQPDWSSRFPWLIQGTTGRGGTGLDLGLFGDVPIRLALERWRQLQQTTGMAAAVHARQVHQLGIRWHDCNEPGLTIGDGFDGHATRSPGLLLTVSVADCVPIFLVAAAARAICLLHGGWRGIAGGILESAIALLGEQAEAGPTDLHVHCGPAICGACYQVGPEVVEALRLGAGNHGPGLVDLRAVLAHRAIRAGLPARQITISAYCTRCSDGQFWSHRGGCRERQLGVVGIKS